MTERLADGYDVALFDLDGVVYLGPEPVEGAADGIRETRAMGVRVMFVTNNAARTPEAVAAQLVQLGVESTAAEVVTSAQAGARMLARQLPARSRVLVVGSQALVDEVIAVGMVPVASHIDAPAAVIQGYDPQAPWSRFDEAGFSIQRGARWFATNTDATRPTDLGLVPGAGAAIAVVRTAVDVDPLVAGKPFRPLLDEAVRRMDAACPIFVGDRLDTDIEGAYNADMDSLFVLTGAHGKSDLIQAPEHQRPTHLGYDLRALIEAPRRIELTGEGARCRAADVRRRLGAWALTHVGPTVASQVDALWALAHASWREPEVDATAALELLSLLP